MGSDVVIWWHGANVTFRARSHINECFVQAEEDAHAARWQQQQQQQQPAERDFMGQLQRGVHTILQVHRLSNVPERSSRIVAFCVCINSNMKEHGHYDLLNLSAQQRRGGSIAYSARVRTA